MLKVEKRIVLQMGQQLDILLIAKQLMVVQASTELVAMKGVVSQLPGMVVRALKNQMVVNGTWSKMGTQLELFKARAPLKVIP